MKRVALVSDYVEDRWYSMDLVAEMLFANLTDQFSGVYHTKLVRPVMRRRFQSLPALGRSRNARKADQFLNRFLEYPRVLRKERAEFDIFHIVDHSYSQLVHDLPGERTVLTCHDLDAFRSVVERPMESRSFFFRAMTRRILRGFQKAAKVICNSMATRDEILRFGLIPGDRLAVLPLAAHPAYSMTPNAHADQRADQLLGGPQKPGAADIVHVGSTVPRKRIDVLLRVFAKVREQVPHVRLIRVGGPFTPDQASMMDELKLWDSTLVAPFLDQAVLASIYRRATVVMQPSAREGFGLPIIEAMACGAPVVATDLPALRETGGSAAAYCSLENIDAWHDSVLELIGRESDRESLRAAGLAQAGKFSWRAYAAGCARLYEELP
jgi:glycosyltransferase involved in cell wall biosynthesis